MNQSANLGTEKIGRLLFRLAIPAVMAQIVNVLYNMVDRIYVGRIPEVGAQALTGLGVCMPIIMIISSFAALIGMGGAPRASISMGKKDNAKAEKILGNCTTALVAAGVLLTAITLLFCKPMLMAFGASSNTIPHALAYMQTYAMGNVFVMLSLGLNGFITAQGFAKASMLSVVIGAVCNIILDPIFIFGLNMGIRGAALATVLSQCVSTLWVLCFLTGKRTILRIRKENLRLSQKVLMPCLALGLAPFIMQSTESILSICFNTSLLKYGGDIAVGAMTILTTVMQFSMLPLIGLASGGQPIISYNFGAKNAQRTKAAFWLELRVALIYSAVIWLIVLCIPGILARMFTPSTELIECTTWAMRIYMGASVIFGAQIVCQQALIAIGSAKTSMFLAILRKIVLLIPLIYILPHVFENQVMAVFLAEPIADVLAVTTTVVLFSVQFKRALSKI